MTTHCPWCDNRPDETCVQDVGGPGDPWFTVICPECDAQGPKATSPKAAIAAWNLRNGDRGVDPMEEPTVAKAVHAAAQTWGLDPKIVIDGCRKTHTCQARFAVYRFLIVDLGLSRRRASRLIGRDCKTISSGIRRLAGWESTDQMVRARLEHFTSLLS